METAMKLAFEAAKAQKNAARKVPQFRIDVDALADRDAEAVKAEARRAAAAANNAAAAAVLESGKADIDASVFGKHCHFKTGTANGAPVFVNDFDWVDDKKAMVESLYKMGDKKVRPYRSYKVAAKAYRQLRHLPGHKFQNLLEYAIVDESCADNVHYGRVHLEKHVGDMGERFVDINGALPEELTELKGIGEKLAMKIVEYRHANGGFTSIDEFDAAVGHKGALAKALTGNVKPMVNGEKPYDKVSDVKLFEMLLAENHHEIPERLRDGIKASAPEGQKSIYTQKINFCIRKDLECYGYVALDVSSVTNNVFTRSYAVDDGSISFTQVTGYERHIPAGKAATTSIVSVNTGDILRACRGEDDRIEKADKAHVANMVRKMRDGEWKVIRTQVPVGYDSQGNVRYSVVEHTDVVLETTRGDYMSLVYYDKKLVKRSDGRKVHKMVRYTADYVDAHVTGVFTAKDGMVQSTAQDRSDDRTYFNMATQADRDKYHAAFKEATVGAQGFLLNLGTGFTSGQLVDVATRLSSHACSMGMRADQGAHVESIGIVLSKNGFGDGGDAFINVETFGKALAACTESEVNTKDEDALEGKQVQFRAFLMKCTGLLKRAEWIVKELNGLSVAYVDVSKENFAEEELVLLQALGTKLVKGAFDILKVQGKEAEASKLKAALEGIDCVVLYNGKERTMDDCPDIIASLNEVKNVWEFGVCSGYNVLLMPHYAGDTKEDFRRVYTSNQMLKVAYRLAHDTNSHDELEEIVKAMIDRRITELTDYDERAAKAKVDTHFGPIDTSYSANTLLGLNKDDMYRHPELQTLAIRDVMDTLGKECTMDRWPMAGATMMFHMDPSFYALRRRDKKQMDNDYLPEDTILKIRKNGMIEVYSSLANKFFAERGIKPNDRYGFVMKYPAMGTRESALVLFISDEEMARRVNALKGISFHDKLDIINACNHQGYGTVFAPADLPTMGWILAGLDRDGDEGCFVFHEPGKKDLCFFLKEHGFRPLAVNIGKKGIEPKNDPTHDFGFDVFGFASRAKAEFGNMKIGPVTYGFMRCLQPLMADWPVEIKKAYLKRFAQAFGMHKDKGNQVYHPVIDWSKDQDADTFGYAETEGKATGELIISRIKDMKAFTGEDKDLASEWHELIKIAKDLDVLGRHTQELTIDAGKKFYEVAADFVNDVAKAIGLTYQRFGVQFDCDWQTVLEDEAPVKVSTHASEKSLCYKTIFAFDGKTEKDAKTFVPALEELPFFVGKCDQNGVFDFKESTMYFPDFFAKMRRYAINASLDALNNMVAIYKASCEDEDLAAERADRYDVAYDALEQAGVRGEVNYVVDSLAMTVRHAYAERQAEYRKDLIHEWMSVDEENRAEEAILKQLHEDFDVLMERVNNMLRLSKEKAIAAAENIDGVHVGDDTFVDYICGNDNGKGGTENGYVYAGKLLKAELAYTAISRSQVNEARELVSANHRKDAEAITKELADIVEYQQLLVDEKGGISYIGDDDKEVAIAAHVDADRVPEGYYDAVYDEESDSVMLTKPLTDFVEIPEADHDELTLPVMMNAIGDKDKMGESIEKLQVAASEGKKIFIGLSQDRYHNVTVYTKDPSAAKGEGVEAICEVYQGISSKGKRNISKGIAKNLFYGVMGDFVDAVQTATKDENGNVTARFGFITINNLERPNGSKVDEEDDESSFFDGDEPEVEFH